MKINIIGRGNVASHLSKAFANVADVSLINPHTLENYDADSDFTIIAVSDMAIATVARAIPPTRGIIAHTSGSTPLSVLIEKGNQTGVFYPLQTFSKDADLDYSTIPFFIEGANDSVQKKLYELAASISCNVSLIDSEQRRALHTASVFACNFTNHLWALCDSLLHKNGMNFNVVRPLIAETLRKTGKMSPFDAQTGPAVRQDTNTISAHLSLLQNDEELKNIYTLLTQSIISHHTYNKTNNKI